MTTKGKTVFWGTAKPWSTSSPVGSHGYAKQFIKNGWDVVFLTSNITPIHKFISRDKAYLNERFMIHKSKGIIYEEGHLLDYVPWSLVSSKIMPRTWLNYSFGDIDKALLRNSFCNKPDIIWVDFPEFGALFEKYPLAKHVLRIADKNQFFEGFTKSLFEEQIRLAKEADLVIVTSFALEDEIKKLGIPNVVRIPNGVSLERFQSKTVPDVPVDIKDIKKPIALFVGMLENWFDEKLMAEVSALLPEVNFVIIGKDRKNIAQLVKRDNVYFLGSRSPDLIPAYMYHSNIGIIPFKQNEFCDAINPVKYFEYIACGLPVVATESLEFRRLNYPVYLARDAKEFASGIIRASDDSSSKKTALQQLAKSMSWENRWNIAMQNLYK